MSIGGSVTNPYDETETDPAYRDNPSEIDVPSQGDNFPFPSDVSNFPDFTPPDQPPGGIISIPSNPDITAPGPTIPSGIPTGGFTPPTIVPTAPPPPTLPTVNPPNPGKKENPVNIDPIGLPQRDNKAKFLWNLSDFSIPEINIQISFKGILNPFDTSVQRLLFVGLLLFVFYFRSAFIEYLLKFMRDIEEESDETRDLFFKPSKALEEKRLQEKKRKKLQQLSDYITQIKDKILQMRQDNSPEELIVFCYHELDKAFSVFSKLERTKDMTPLEHAMSQFETGEIDNMVLTEIVDLFYRTRFGHKKLDDSAVDRLLDLLNNLVLIKMERPEKRRWKL